MYIIRNVKKNLYLMPPEVDSSEDLCWRVNPEKLTDAPEKAQQYLSFGEAFKDVFALPGGREAWQICELKTVYQVTEIVYDT